MKLSEVYPVNEYGMSSAGSPTPVGNQTMGANARATAQQRTQAPVQSASPTTQPAAQRATSQQAQATVVKASDLSNGDQMVGPEDTELTVISAAGTTSNEVPNDSPNSVVVQDADGNLYAVEPDTEIAAAKPQNESVFVRMARLPVLEQLDILAKLDKSAIDRVWNGIRESLYESTGMGKIKQTIISLIQDTDEESLLQKILKTLQAGNLDERIGEILETDADAKMFVDQITNAMLHIDAPIEEKNEFLEKYPEGIVDVSKLLDGNLHSFSEIVGDGFAQELFSKLYVNLTSQGVGPGEVALAVLSPDIKWSGRGDTGGDIIADGKNIEVKASVKAGGRWVNARKANMNMSSIKESISNASGLDVPARLNAKVWVERFRSAIAEDQLPDVCKTIAKGLFTAVDTTDFEQVLATGDPLEIKDELLRTGYENYKKLSNFQGMLIMNLSSQSVRYFTSYEEMRGNIKSTTIYLYAPESEAMPQIMLVGGSSSSRSSSAKQGRQSTDTVKQTKKPAQPRKSNRVARAQEPEAPGELGRAKLEGVQVTESTKPYFLKPGQLRGSWKDTELRKLGFRQAKNGSWFTDQARWNKLSQMGERHWRKLLENTLSSSTVQEGVPNNDAAAVLKRLMSQPLLTGDIRAQMDAYIAIPDPNMITHFRKIRGEQGDNVDLRDTLRDYAQRLHPTVQRQAGL